MPCCDHSQLQRERIVHHFRCSEQAPESFFRQGELLICPKCRMELGNTADHDFPGTVMICRNCRSVNSE